MNLTEKLISKPVFRIGAALTLAGILSFSISTCVSVVYKVENQINNYLENLYLDNISSMDK